MGLLNIFFPCKFCEFLFKKSVHVTYVTIFVGIQLFNTPNLYCLLLLLHYHGNMIFLLFILSVFLGEYHFKNLFKNNIWFG